MKKLFIRSMVFMILLFAGCAIHKQNLKPQNIGDLAYDFTLPDQNGNNVTLSDVLKAHDGAVIAFYPKDESMN